MNTAATTRAAAVAAEKSDFAAHVALIRAQDANTSANDAKMRAWLEGPAGLARRRAAA